MREIVACKEPAGVIGKVTVIARIPLQRVTKQSETLSRIRHQIIPQSGMAHPVFLFLEIPALENITKNEEICCSKDTKSEFQMPLDLELLG